MRLAPPMALLAVTLAAWAAPASAWSLGTPPETGLDRGPFFAGDEIAWQEASCLNACDPEEISCQQTIRVTLRAAAPGAPARRVTGGRRECASSRASYSAGSDFGLSERWFTVLGSTRESDEITTGGLSLSAGRRGRAPVVIYRCHTDDLSGTALNATYALDGDTLAWPARPCSESPQVAVRNLATGRRLTVDPSPGMAVQGLDIAGSRLAVATDDAIRVYDTSSGALLSTTTRAEPRHDTSFSAVRVDASGQAAYVTGYQCGSAAWAAGPGRATSTRLPIRSCGSMVLPQAGGYVYLAQAKTAAAVRYLPRAPGRDRAVVTLPRAAPWPDLDVRGDRVAYATGACDGGVTIRVGRISAPSRVAPITCPIAARGGNVVARLEGRLRTAMVCPAGCSGRILVRIGRAQTAERYFALRPSRKTQSVTTLVGRNTRTALKRGLDPRRLRAVAITQDPSGRRVTRLRTARPVRRLGQRDPAIAALQDPVVRARGGRPVETCFVESSGPDEKFGYSSIVTSYDDDRARCLRRRRLTVRSSVLAVRTAPEATSLAVRLGNAAGRRCSRSGRGRWRCVLVGRGAGARPRLRLVLTYPRGVVSISTVPAR